MIKIAYIIEKFPSESEQFILNEILELEKQNFDILIIALKKSRNGTFKIYVNTLKSPVFYLPHFFIYILSFLNFRNFTEKFQIYFSTCFKESTNFRTILKKTRYFLIALYFERKIKKLRISHVHAHFAFITSDVAYLLSKLLKVEYSFTAHAQDIYLNRNGIIQKAMMSKFVITCNIHNKILIENIIKSNNFEKKVFNIYHGINLDKWPFVEHKINKIDSLKILTVARLVEKKGIIYGIRAVQMIIERGYHLKYIIIGDGILADDLKDYISNEKLSDSVEFLGYKDHEEIYRLMASSDIFILPCIEAQNGDMDGLPNVLLESLAIGLPVISSRISAVEELITHEKTGLLVNPKNEDELAEAIMLLISNTELYVKLSKEGRRKVLEEFDINISTKKLVNIFEQFILK